MDVCEKNKLPVYHKMVQTNNAHTKIIFKTENNVVFCPLCDTSNTEEKVKLKNTTRCGVVLPSRSLEIQSNTFIYMFLIELKLTKKK